MKPRSLAFKILQTEWYKKLSESGFKDLEDDKGRLLNHRAGLSRSRDFCPGLYEENLTYYMWASSKLHDGSLFQTDIDREIWRLHSEGLSSRKIERYIDLEQWWICKKIKRIRKYLLQAEVRDSRILYSDDDHNEDS